MSETQIAAIFGMVQRLERKLDSTLKEFSDRIEALEERSNPNNTGTETNTDGPSLATICEDLAILGSAIGSVHAAVSSAEPLPDYILEHRTMAHFVDNYPDRAAAPYDAAARAKQLAEFDKLPPAELRALLAEAREIAGNPAEPNRRRYNARTFIPALESRLQDKELER